MNYYCKNCGAKASSITSLTNAPCPRHPTGHCKGQHELYEGTEKSQYQCKNCGAKASSIASLTGAPCPHHPAGHCKGPHAPAL